MGHFLPLRHILALISKQGKSPSMARPANKTRH